MAYLDELVPSSRNNHWVLWAWREADARDPLGVSLIGDGELAVTKSIPQLDGAIARSGDNLTVVGREGDGENVTSVSDEAASSLAGRELPETEGLVPGRRKSICTV